MQEALVEWLFDLGRPLAPLRPDEPLEPLRPSNLTYLHLIQVSEMPAEKTAITDLPKILQIDPFELDSEKLQCRDGR